MLRELIEHELRKILSDEISCTPPAERDFGSSHKIVIAQRGFVFAGDCHREGEHIVITNAVNIRRWGTTKGLGELAEHGPKPETKADASGTVRIHQLAVVGMIDCQERIDATT